MSGSDSQNSNPILPKERVNVVGRNEGGRNAVGSWGDECSVKSSIIQGDGERPLAKRVLASPGKH